METDESACSASINGKNCEPGKWCCRDPQTKKTECVPCPHSIFGRCLVDENWTCKGAGKEPWNELSQKKEMIAEKLGKVASVGAQAIADNLVPELMVKLGEQGKTGKLAQGVLNETLGEDWYKGVFVAPDASQQT